MYAYIILEKYRFIDKNNRTNEEYFYCGGKSYPSDAGVVNNLALILTPAGNKTRIKRKKARFILS